MISSFSPDGRNKAICKHPWLLISCLYLLSVALRFALALLFRHGPTISIDESLYINIAKSLAAGEGITYRSQPIPYMYLLYPLLLVPLYLLPFPVNFYRLIQLYNAFLICTSIFPVFLFAKDFTGSNKTDFFVCERLYWQRQKIHSCLCFNYAHAGSAVSWISNG